MRILITGNLGYVGPAVSARLRQDWPDAALIGFDAGWFTSCLTVPQALAAARVMQRSGDVRDIDLSLLRGVDAVVHLAAVSNDPLGTQFAAMTDSINRAASLRLAALAAAAGVRHFVFASSCSVYGAGGVAARREDDAAQPLTAYASSKLCAEAGLRRLSADGMIVTCLRFATACGMSARPRLDLVLNDFVASALTGGRIDVLSDGSPWRPLIDVQDMARAIAWAVGRPMAQGGPFLVVNTGSDAGNHQVAGLANAVAAALPGTTVQINAAAPPDRRSYRADFSLFRALAPAHQPQIGLATSIAGMIHGLRGLGFNDTGFRDSPAAIRLHALSGLIRSGQLSAALRWTHHSAAMASRGRRCRLADASASARATIVKPAAIHGSPS